MIAGSMRGWATVLVIAMWVQTGARATDRCYNDVTVYSPKKRLRLEAKSPANAPNYTGRRAFQADFEYTLFDNQTGELLWQRKQPMKERKSGRSVPDGEQSPVAAWVDDARRVVIRTGRDEVLVLAPDDGAKLLQFTLLDQFSQEDRKYVMRTSAGPAWSMNSHWFFLHSVGAGAPKERGATRTYFVVRTWWGRHIIVDVDRLGVVKTANSPDADFLVAPSIEELNDLWRWIRDAEREWVLETLRRNAAHLDTDEKGHERPYDAITAAHMAGRLMIQEAIPLLRKLEGSTFVGTSALHGGFGAEHHTLRQLTQLSLRRLGQVPGDYPCIVLGEGGAGPQRSARASRVHLIEVGMSLPDLIDAIGYPDYSAGAEVETGWGFDYDMDTDLPYTLRVVLKQIGDRLGADFRVVKTVRIEPAAWKEGNQRDRSVCHWLL